MKKPVKPNPIGSKPTEPNKPEEFKSITVFRTPSYYEYYGDYDYEDLTDKERMEILLEDYTVSSNGFIYDQWDRKLKLKGASLQEVYDFTYWPHGYSGVSIKEILKKHPDIPLEDLVITTEAWRHRGSSDSDIELEVSYPVKRPEYEKEMVVYEKKMKEYKAALRKHKKDAKAHKVDLAQWRQDKKNYEEWRTNRIQQLEAAGEL